MQDTSEYLKTECFAKEEEEKERIWQQTYGTKIDEVVAMMDILLEKGTEQSRLELKNLFLNKDFFDNYEHTDMIAVMYVIMQIYERERQAKIFPTILECGKTVKELQRYFEQLKFILYRIDFEVDNQSETELLEYIKNNRTSVITIETMITTNVMRPMKLALQLERIFAKNFMYKQLFAIRNYINERWNGNHRILLELAELYKETGREEYANECMIKVPNILQDLYRDEISLLSLQEELWKIRYKDTMAIETFGESMKRYGTSIEAWETLLLYEKIEEEDYYLTLTEQFLNKNMVNFALKTLKIGARIIPQNESINSILGMLELRMGGNGYE